MFSITAWNIRGLNYAFIQLDVRQVVNENNLSVCAILESHVDISALSNVCSKVFRNCEWSSNASLFSKGCRIIIGWNKDVVDALIISQTSQAVHVKLIHKADKNVIFSTFIYASNDPKERRHLWRDLGFHKSVVRGVPWILLGDFNVALNMEDSLTGSSSMTSAMCDFKDYVKHIEVIDINCSGLQDTWNQKPKGKGGTLKKLDRVIGNIDFVDMFPGAYAIFQLYRISYHSPAVLKIPSHVTSKPKPFKFYNFLARKAKFLETILSVWISQVNGYSMFQVVQKMRMLKKPLLKLLHDQGNLHDCVNLLRVKLDGVQIAIDKDPHNEFLRDEEAMYLTAFNEAKTDEEQFLIQKSKVEWLEVGDSNFAYFHKSIKSRNQRSCIKVIRNAKNVEVLGSCVPDVFVERYEAFLGTQAPCIDLDPSGLFTKKVSDVACDNMLRPITSDEIKHAMFDIGDDKAPGPDG
ncbi:RNA-directed DNA polymerase, eukaryota, reverse transcriptase zinc-binding domain protein [Tanacetum coccineum]